jgi:hypothetical protein
VDPEHDEPAIVRPRATVGSVLLALVVVLVVAGVLWAGIWAATRYADRDSWAGRGTPVAQPRVPPEVTQTEQPAAPEPVGQILHGLKNRVLRSAGVPKPVGGVCDRNELGSTDPATLRCTVTYDGLAVDYRVTARSAGADRVQWDATADRTVITREGLLARFWYRYGPLGATFTDLRCDDGFPAVALVPVKAPLDRYCWAKPHRGKTVRVTFMPSDQGPVDLFTEIQGNALRYMR